MKPSNKKFAKVFDDVAQKYDDISNPYTVKRRVAFFQKYAKGKCLEVGAGTGKISEQLAKKHAVVATDISPKMVKEIKRRKIKAVICDAEKLPFKSKTFDTVIGGEMIYYLDHPDKFIKEAHRVLKTGGKLLISTANEDTKIYDRIRGILRSIGIGSMYFDDGIKKFITQKQVESLLKKNKFSVKMSQKAIVLPFEFMDWMNKIIEKTPLSYFGSFIFINAKKP